MAGKRVLHSQFWTDQVVDDLDDIGATDEKATPAFDIRNLDRASFHLIRTTTDTAGGDMYVEMNNYSSKYQDTNWVRMPDGAFSMTSPAVTSPGTGYSILLDDTAGDQMWVEFESSAAWVRVRFGNDDPEDNGNVTAIFTGKAHG